MLLLAGVRAAVDADAEKISPVSHPAADSDADGIKEQSKIAVVQVRSDFIPYKLRVQL